MSGRRSVISVGMFDGVHRGHLAILERAFATGRERALPVGVVTFDPHPDVVLNKGAFQAVPPLTPPEEKRRLLSALGVAWIQLLPFTRELAALSPEDFVDRHLLQAFGMEVLVVGRDFALGRGRSGDVARLRSIGERRGFEVQSVELVDDGSRPISSTRIRALLTEGRAAEAARLLGRPYRLEGTVVRGEGIGRTLGFPTANLRLHEEKMVPADGIYVARAIYADQMMPGAVSIGARPTFGGQQRVLEAYLLDFEGELAGRELAVELLEWLRPQVKFDSPRQLALAMRQDVAAVRERLATAGHDGR